MPLFLEPNQRFQIVLDVDKDKPADSRPSFFAKSVSMRDSVALSELIDNSLDAKDSDELYCKTIDIIMQYIVGWSNMGGLEFTADNVRVLTYQEARELLGKLYANQHVKPEEKKS